MRVRYARGFGRACASCLLLSPFFLTLTLTLAPSLLFLSLPPSLRACACCMRARVCVCCLVPGAVLPSCSMVHVHAKCKAGHPASSIQPPPAASQPASSIQQPVATNWQLAESSQHLAARRVCYLNGVPKVSSTLLIQQRKCPWGSMVYLKDCHNNETEVRGFPQQE